MNFHAILSVPLPQEDDPGSLWLAHKTIDFSQYSERTAGFAHARDVLAGNDQGNDHALSEKIQIPCMHMMILELRK